MAEFGEQLRRAREDRGITQQTLAEQLYVTRQTVSRWECGERYPDLVTLKKIAQVLEVGVGSLLSEDDTRHIAERSPAVEQPALQRVSLLLSAAIAVSCLISVLGTLGRIPHFAAGAADSGVLAGQVLGSVLIMAAFAAGFIWAVKGVFFPKKVGLVMMAFFAGTLLRDLSLLTSGAQAEETAAAGGVIALSILGMVSAYAFFWGKRGSKLWYYVLIGVSLLGAVRAVCTFGSTLIAAPADAAVEVALHAVLPLCIFALLLCQAYGIKKKRAMAEKLEGRTP